MTKVIYVRHGETAWNIDGKYQGQTDVELSEKGKAQAEKLAKDFPVSHIKAIYASDLKRAAVTAEFIARQLNVPVHLTPNLRELNFGKWEGLTYDQIVTEWPEAIHTFFDRPDQLSIPEGETFQVLQQRAMREIREICRENPGETVCVVAHGAILRTILASALHMNLRYVWHLRQYNTGVSIVDYDEKGDAVLELLNNTAHLQRKG